MKKLLIAVFILMLFTNCEKKRLNDLEGNMISRSECKFNKHNFAGDDESCIEYYYNTDSQILNLKHINSAFNCCPDDIGFDLSVSGDTLIISEYEKEQGCNCNCLFDIEIEISRLEAQAYVIKFVEPYLYEEEELTFEVDLLMNTSGTYCVDRNNYPWGI